MSAVRENYVLVCVPCSQAMDYARKLRDDRGKGDIVVVEDGEETQGQMGDDEYNVSTQAAP